MLSLRNPTFLQVSTHTSVLVEGYCASIVLVFNSWLFTSTVSCNFQPHTFLAAPPAPPPPPIAPPPPPPSFSTPAPPVGTLIRAHHNCVISQVWCWKTAGIRPQTVLHYTYIPNLLPKPQVSVYKFASVPTVTVYPLLSLISFPIMFTQITLAPFLLYAVTSTTLVTRCQGEPCSHPHTPQLFPRPAGYRQCQTALSSLHCQVCVCVFHQTFALLSGIFQWDDWCTSYIHKRSFAWFFLQAFT